MRKFFTLFVAGVITVTPATSATAQSGRFNVGERTVYRIDYWNTTRSDMRALLGIDTTSAIPSPLVHNIVSELHGELVQTVLQRDSIVLVAMSLANPGLTLSINGTDAGEGSRSIERNLAKTMLVTLDHDGLVKNVQLNPSLDETSRSFAKTIVASIQFVVPGSRGTHWDVTEQDQAGVYLASYKRDSASIVKARVRYVEEKKRLKGDVVVEQIITPQGRTTGVVDRFGKLVTLAGDETQQVTVAEKQVAQGETRLRLRLVESKSVSAAELNALRDIARELQLRALAEGLFSLERVAAGDTSIQRAELGNANVTTLLADLANLEATRDTSVSTTSLYLKFKALVFLNPEASTSLRDVLLKAAPNSQSMLMLSEALGAVGNPEAQTALATVIRARNTEWPVLATLIPTLGGVRVPTEEAVQLMLDLGFNSTNAEIASTARLAAGTLARRLEPQSPGRAHQIVKRLITALESAKTAGEKRDLLLAIGNSGSSIALPVINRFTRDSDESVRAAATHAMRWIATH